MRQAVLWFVLGVGLVAALAVYVVQGDSVLAQHVRAASPTGELITYHWAVDGKHQQLVIIDPKQQAMGVYQVDGKTGTITLQSVRRFQHDLSLRGFNEVRPYAEEIRAMVESRPSGTLSPGELRGGPH